MTAFVKPLSASNYSAKAVQLYDVAERILMPMLRWILGWNDAYREDISDPIFGVRRGLLMLT